MTNFLIKSAYVKDGIYQTQIIGVPRNIFSHTMTPVTTLAHFPKRLKDSLD